MQYTADFRRRGDALPKIRAHGNQFHQLRRRHRDRCAPELDGSTVRDYEHAFRDFPYLDQRRAWRSVIRESARAVKFAAYQWPLSARDGAAARLEHA